MENKWRASRYGINGKLIDFGKQREVPLRELVGEILEFVSDAVDELGSRGEIEYIRRILDEGTAADRELRVFEKTGDLKAVVDYMIQETEFGCVDSGQTVIAGETQ
jgi:carboxylate-amine ligase